MLMLIVMSLCAYRLTRLVVRDDFPPVLWLRDRMVGDWRERTQTEIDTSVGLAFEVGVVEDVVMVRHTRWTWVPGWLADLLSCPWCASGWIALGVVGTTTAFASVPVPLITWGAVWALSALLASRDWA